MTFIQSVQIVNLIHPSTLQELAQTIDEQLARTGDTIISRLRVLGNPNATTYISGA